MASTVKPSAIDESGITQKVSDKLQPSPEFEGSGEETFSIGHTGRFEPDVSTLEMSSQETPVTSRTLLDEEALHSAVPAATDQETGIHTSGLPETHTRTDGLMVKVQTQVEDRSAATDVAGEKETRYTFDSVTKERVEAERPVTVTPVIKTKAQESTSEAPSVITEIKAIPEKVVTASTVRSPATVEMVIREKVSVKSRTSLEFESSGEELIAAQQITQFGTDIPTKEIISTLLPVTSKTPVVAKTFQSTVTVTRESEEEMSGCDLSEVHTEWDGLLVKVHTQTTDKTASTVVIGEKETRYVLVPVTSETEEVSPHDTVTPVIGKTSSETPSVITVSKTIAGKVVMASTVKPSAIDESGITQKVSDKLQPSPEFEGSGEETFSIGHTGRFEPDVSTLEMSSQETPVTSRTLLDEEALHSAVPAATDQETSGLPETHTRTDGLMVKVQTQVEDRSAATDVAGEKETRYTFDSVTKERVEAERPVTVTPVIKTKAQESTSEAPSVITEIKAIPEKVVTASTVKSPATVEMVITAKVSVKSPTSLEFESSGEELIATQQITQFGTDIPTKELSSTLLPVTSKTPVDAKTFQSTVTVTREREEEISGSGLSEEHTEWDGLLVKVHTQTTDKPASTVVIGEKETRYVLVPVTSETEEVSPHDTVTPVIGKTSSETPSVITVSKTIAGKVVMASTVKPSAIDESGITQKVSDKLQPSPEFDGSGEETFSIGHSGQFEPDVSTLEMSSQETPVTSRTLLDEEALHSVVPAATDQETGITTSGLPDALTHREGSMVKVHIQVEDRSAATSVVTTDKETRYVFESVTKELEVEEGPVTATPVIKIKSQESTSEAPSVITEIKTIPEKVVTASTVESPVIVESGITEKVSVKLPPSPEFEGSGEELTTAEEILRLDPTISTIEMSSTLSPVTGKTLVDTKTLQSPVSVTHESVEEFSGSGSWEVHTEKDGLLVKVHTQTADKSASTVVVGDKETRYTLVSITSEREEGAPYGTTTPAIGKTPEESSTEAPSVIGEDTVILEGEVMESTVKSPVIIVTEKVLVKLPALPDFESSGDGMFTIRPIGQFDPNVSTLEMSSQESPVTSRTSLDEEALRSAVPAATDQETGIHTSGLPETHTRTDGLIVKVQTQVEDRSAATDVAGEKETRYTFDSVTKERVEGERPVTVTPVIKTKAQESTSEAPSVITEIKAIPEKVITASTVKSPETVEMVITEKVSVKSPTSLEFESSGEELIAAQQITQFGTDIPTKELISTLLPVTSKTPVDAKTFQSTVTVTREREEEISGSGLSEEHTEWDGLLVKVHTQTTDKPASTVVIGEKETRYVLVPVTSETEEVSPHDTVTPVIGKTSSETPSVITVSKTIAGKVVMASTAKPSAIDESGITQKVSDKLQPSPEFDGSGEETFSIGHTGRFEPDVSTLEMSSQETPVTSRTLLDELALHSVVPAATDQETSGLPETHTRTDGLMVKVQTQVEDRSAATDVAGEKETRHKNPHQKPHQ
ncbi:uncharacterized protein LOC144611327 [Rhinoraja longicauda]